MQLPNHMEQAIRERKQELDMPSLERAKHKYVLSECLRVRVASAYCIHTSRTSTAIRALKYTRMACTIPYQVQPKGFADGPTWFPATRPRGENSKGNR